MTIRERVDRLRVEGATVSLTLDQRVATGFNRPTWVGAAPGDPDALWVLEQPGRLVRLQGERRETQVDLGDRGSSADDEGAAADGVDCQPGPP